MGNMEIRTFKLTDSFIEQFKDRQPNWGFNGLGYIVYKRTYSRENSSGSLEEFWETCKRVVEGCYNVQKQHCKILRLPWDNQKAQKSAQEMYTRMWQFKFGPSGRGYWMMGAPIIETLGSAPLQNCGFVSTKGIKEDFSDPFCWLMDMSMLGVGVGFDTKGAGLVKIQKPTYDDSVFFIEDTREGWVDGLRIVLLSFVGRSSIPKFDFSKVRGPGLPIKGFGGISSGPEPLKEMYVQIQQILNEKIDQLIDSTTIVDVCNLIGRCVVSGNVRRSAEISFGDPNDEQFLNLKNPEINPKALTHHRWASNNSIFAEVGMDYNKFAAMTAKNGEPGYLWLDNAKNNSRMNGNPDFSDTRAVGANPCFGGDTLIAVADGRNAVSIKQLAEEGKDVMVYSLTKNGNMEIQMARNPRITRQAAKLVRIHLDDGSYFDVTPDHNVILRDGSIKSAMDLLSGDSLPVLKKYKDKIVPNGKQYWRVETDLSNPSRIFEHRLIAKFIQPDIWNQIYDINKQNGWIDGGLVVHHKDYNSLNNKPENLEIMSFKDHAKFHAQYDHFGDKNGMFGKHHTNEAKTKIGLKTIERNKNLEHKQKLKDSHTHKERENNSKKMTEFKAQWNKNYYLEQEKLTDLKTIWIGEKMFAVKNCEHCKIEFIVSWGKRDRLYCSSECFNVYLRDLEKRKENQLTFFKKRQQQILHSQIMLFKDLQNIFRRNPTKKEWETSCKEKYISFRFQNISSNPYVLKSFSDLKQRSAVYNHRIVKVENLEGEHVVYNLAVDENHTVCMSLTTNLDADVFYLQPICQCVEQTLEDRELCCLVETYPSHHEDFEDYKRTLKFAYLYAKTVTLIPTHDDRTNMVMMRNRRIGCSMSGIVQAMKKFGTRNFFLMFCDKGYEYLRQLDGQYSDWLCVRASIKITSVKPSGTVSLLSGVTPGIHFPHAKNYIRRVRFQSNSPLVEYLDKCGYPKEIDAYSPNTVVFSFPIEEEYFNRCKDEVSIWEQLEIAAQMQQYWADNQVSATVTFKKNEAKDIGNALTLYETRLKGISFLPDEEHGYTQAPYEKISEQQYKKMMQNISSETIVNAVHEETERFCENDTCMVK